MKILIIDKVDTPLLAVKPEHLRKLQSIDQTIKIVLIPFSNKEEINKELPDAEIIAGHQMNIPSIADAKKLKLIQSFSAGVDKILTEEVKNSDVLVSNVSGIHAIPIAEHVLGFMLIFTRKFYDTFKKQQEKIWRINQDATEIFGKTVLVIGLGHIGEEIARLANCLGANVIAIKQNIKDKPNFVSRAYKMEELTQVLPRADFVILALPLTQSTKHLFDMNKLKKMKKSAYLINIGRGALINEADLTEALRQKLIAGAGLDVTEIEPLPKESPLWKMENAVITPHHSGLSERYMDRAFDLFCLNLKAFTQNKPLPNLVDKNRGY